LASVRSTLDPLTLTPLRNAVVHSAWGRGKIDLPPGIAKKLNDTRVFVGTDVRQSKFRKDLAKSMRVERVSDTARNQKFKVKDERQQEQQADTGRKPEVDQGRKQDTGHVTADGAKGNKEAQQQTRQLGKEERKENGGQERKQQKAQQKSEVKAAPQAQAARVDKSGKQKSEVKAAPKSEAVRVDKPGKQQSEGASKHESKQKQPAQPTAQGQGAGGKGKGKKP
jgi:hypothetical protein